MERGGKRDGLSRVEREHRLCVERELDGRVAAEGVGVPSLLPGRIVVLDAEKPADGLRGRAV